MAKIIAGMTMSLDGFVEDTNGSAAALYPDFDELAGSAYMKTEQSDTGAVLMGRRSFGMAPDPDSYADSYEFQVPIFVVTHTAPTVTPVLLGAGREAVRWRQPVHLGEARRRRGGGSHQPPIPRCEVDSLCIAERDQLLLKVLLDKPLSWS